MYQVLIVDDDPPITQGIKNIIDDYFPELYQGIPCNSAVDAIRILSSQVIHVIICDVKMPGMSGLELLKLLKENGIKAPVIILSGYDNYSYIRSALLNGAHDYLLKPININHFLQILDALPESLAALPPLRLKSSAQLAGKTGREPDRRDHHIYFDLNMEKDSCAPLYDPATAKSCLPRMIHSIITGSLDEMQEAIDAYFYFRPNESSTPSMIKEELNQFIYTLMNQYTPLIPVIAAYKFTPDDIHTNIKNLPTISQLKATMTKILTLYIEKTHGSEDQEKYFIKVAKKYIEEHYQDDLTLDLISAQVHLSPTYFSSLFKSDTGITLREYIRQFRMEKAKELLGDPALKIYEISEAVGYPNAAHFNRSFKNCFGVSPSEYRNLLPVKNQSQSDIPPARR